MRNLIAVFYFVKNKNLITVMRMMDVYADNRNIIADGVPEIEAFMKDVLPDEKKREQFKLELLQIVPDVRGFLPTTL